MSWLAPPGSLRAEFWQAGSWRAAAGSAAWLAAAAGRVPSRCRAAVLALLWWLAVQM